MFNEFLGGTVHIGGNTSTSRGQIPIPDKLPSRETLRKELEYPWEKFRSQAVEIIPERTQNVLDLLELVREYPLQHKSDCAIWHPSAMNDPPLGCSCGLAARLAELKGGEK